MFTGLVQSVGRVTEAATEAAGRRFVIAGPGLGEPFALGESIAVNGCCLTIVAVAGERFAVEAGPETLARTNLGDLAAGGRVNLERALRAGDRLGGHFVQGHIDTTAELLERQAQGAWEFFWFAIDPAYAPLLIPKGSIALDGTSLTLVDVGRDRFSIMLIPHTLGATTLGELGPGARVNVELDMIAKHIQKLLAALDLGAKK